MMIGLIPQAVSAFTAQCAHALTAIGGPRRRNLTRQSGSFASGRFSEVYPGGRGGGGVMSGSMDGSSPSGGGAGP